MHATHAKSFASITDIMATAARALAWMAGMTQVTTFQTSKLAAAVPVYKSFRLTQSTVVALLAVNVKSPAEL